MRPSSTRANDSTTRRTSARVGSATVDELVAQAVNQPDGHVLGQPSLGVVAQRRLGEEQGRSAPDAAPQQGDGHGGAEGAADQHIGSEFLEHPGLHLDAGLEVAGVHGERPGLEMLCEQPGLASLRAAFEAVDELDTQAGHLVSSVYLRFLHHYCVTAPITRCSAITLRTVL